MENFIEVLMKNLEKNGFPSKKVAFDLETMYEKAEDKRLSFNKVLDELKSRGVDHSKKGDRIIFKPLPKTNPFEGLNPNFMAQAQEMMANMDADELASTQAMVQERLAGMSETERQELFEQLKGMGLG